MILVTDVHYTDDLAQVAGVLFEGWDSALPVAQWARTVEIPSEYVPGQFYRRELPALLKLINLMGPAWHSIDIIVVDGYVDLNQGKPGLGRHLWWNILESKMVVGVAKSPFRGSLGTEVFRGISRKPLYVTAAGMDEDKAADAVRGMHGQYRFPTMLKRVDRLARDLEDDVLVENLVGSQRFNGELMRASEDPWAVSRQTMGSVAHISNKVNPITPP